MPARILPDWMFDPIEELEVERLLRLAQSFRDARTRLVAFLRVLPLVETPLCSAWCGLIHRHDHLRHGKPTPPHGWKAVKEWDRNTWLVMPMWLYPLYIARRDWQHWLYLPLMRAGLWRVAEGDYYSNGHWAWPTRTQ